MKLYYFLLTIILSNIILINYAANDKQDLEKNNTIKKTKTIENKEKTEKEILKNLNAITKVINNSNNPRQILPSQKKILRLETVINKINDRAENAKKEPKISEFINNAVSDKNTADKLSNEFNHLLKLKVLPETFTFDSFKNAVFFAPFTIFPLYLYDDFYKTYPECYNSLNNIEIPCHWQNSQVLKEISIFNYLKKSDYSRAMNIIERKVHETTNKINDLQSELNSSDDEIISLQEKLQELKWILKDLNRLKNKTNKQSA